MSDLTDLKAAIERMPFDVTTAPPGVQTPLPPIASPPPVVQPIASPPPVRLHKHNWFDLSTHNDAGMRKAVCRDCGARWYEPRDVPLPVTS
jgi:hypothetical protein